MFEPLFDTLSTLPVMRFRNAVQTFFDDGSRVMIVRAETGAGKTLCIPTLVAERYQGARVLVLEPNRYLATDAADAIAELIDRPLGEVVAVALGKSDGVTTQAFRRQSPVTYSTYGYALQNQLITSADIIILDEAHEQTLEGTVVQAIVRHRLRMGHPIKLIIMSATLNADDHVDSWDEFGAGLVEIAGRPFECTVEHVRPERDFPTAAEMAQQCLRLVEEGCGGVLAFVSATGDVPKLRNELVQLAAQRKLAVDVADITTRSGYQDRRRATLPPRAGRAKILIGTRVIEAGVNIPWADAGVSDGLGVEKSLDPVTRSIIMPTVPLSQWRLEHQKGRLGRFKTGRFVLLHKLAWEERAQFVEPEVRRLPLTALVLHAASVGIDARNLEFYPTVDDQAVADAFDYLVATGLVSPQARLGEAGRQLVRLNLSLTGTLMLREALRLKALALALPLIAAHEMGDMRLQLIDRPIYSVLSDLISNAITFIKAHMLAESQLPMKTKQAAFTRNNWSMRRYRIGLDKMNSLAREFGVTPDFSPYGALDIDSGIECDATVMAAEDQLRMIILGATLSEVFNYNHTTQHVTRALAGDTGDGWHTDRESAVRQADLQTPDSWYVTGRLREIRPHDTTRRPFTMLEQISLFSVDELAGYVEMRGDWLTQESNPDGTATVRSLHNGHVFFTYTPPPSESALGSIVETALTVTAASPAPAPAPAPVAAPAAAVPAAPAAPEEAERFAGPIDLSIKQRLAEHFGSSH